MTTVNTTPRVSVVLPVFNGARFLEQSIRSILDQEFQELELLVCDDASKDTSVAICESFDDPRIRLLRHTRNQGLFPTLNELIENSRGDLVRLWAQDDRMYPDCIATEVRFMNDHPELAMSYCASDAMDADDQLVQAAPVDRTPTILTPSLASKLMFYFGSLGGNIATFMLRRDVFDRVGFFREDLKVAGDFEMWVRICERHPIGFIRTPLVCLRCHTGQFSQRSGVVPHFARENRGIQQELLRRLGPELRRHGESHLRRRFHIKIAHHAVRCMMARDVSGAVAALRALADIDRPVPVFLWWFLSGNGRWLKSGRQHSQIIEEGSTRSHLLYEARSGGNS